MNGAGRMASAVPERLQRAALLDINARDLRVGGAMTFCLIAFVTLLMRDVADGTALYAWVAAITLAAVLRTAVSWTWRRRRRAATVASDAIGTLRRWEMAYSASALCTGLAWGSVTALGGEEVGLPAAFVLTIALLLASASSAASRIAQALFGLPIVLSQEWNLLRLARVEEGSHAAIAGVLWLVLVVLLVAVKRQSSTVLRESVAARIQHERRASEQIALIENAPLGILVVRDTRIAVCNDTLLRLFGYRRKEELIGQSVRLLIPDDDAWRDAVEQSRIALAGSAPPRVVRRRRADGTVFEAMFKMAAVRTGAETEFIGIYEDVQERLVAEEAYRDALRMQRLVFESAGEGIAIVRDGVIEQANQALAELLGQPVGELTDRPLQSIFEDPQSWSEIERHFQRLGTTFKLERRIVRVDGRGAWVNVTGRLIDEPARSSSAAGPATEVRRSIWVLADLSIQKRKEAENWHHANHDVMTGLPNRRFLQDRLDQALVSARRDGRRVAAVELDLDGFKSINDNYGHRVGDAVLEEVARRLSTVVRELDTVGRWGGDEFVLVLRDIESRDVVEETVKRVIAHLSEPVLHMGQKLVVGASVGIALYPEHGQEVESLMLAADLAMYESKSAGGNTWRFASPSAGGARGKYRPAAPASMSDATRDD